MKSRTQESRRSEAESRMLQSALHLVGRRGSERMTLAEVGLAAGYSRGLAAHHFGTKLGLLRRLAQHIGENYDRHRRSGPRLPPGIETLRGAVRLYFAINDQNSTDTRAILILMGEALLDGAPIREDIARYNKAIVNGLVYHIKKGQDHGEIRTDLDAAAAAALLIGAMRGVMTQSLMDNDVNLIRVRDLLLEIIDKVLAA